MLTRLRAVCGFFLADARDGRRIVGDALVVGHAWALVVARAMTSHRYITLAFSSADWPVCFAFHVLVTQWAINAELSVR
ncbi:MAG: hypothetical protein AAF539_16535, partial [Planctomycetota bacterium]